MNEQEYRETGNRCMNPGQKVIVLTSVSVLFVIVIMSSVWIYLQSQRDAPATNNERIDNEQLIERSKIDGITTDVIEQTDTSLTHNDVLAKDLRGEGFYQIYSDYRYKTDRENDSAQLRPDSVDAWITMLYEKHNDERTFLTSYIPNYLATGTVYTLANDLYYQKGNKPMAVFVGNREGLFGAIAPPNDVLRTEYDWTPNTFYDLHTGQKSMLNANQEYLLVDVVYDEDGPELRNTFFIILDFAGEYATLSQEDKKGGVFLSRIVTESFEQNNNTHSISFVSTEGKEYVVKKFEEEPHSISLTFSYPNYCMTYFDYNYDTVNDSKLVCANVEDDRSWQVPIDEDRRILSARIEDGILHYSLSHTCADLNKSCTSFYTASLYEPDSITEVVSNVPTGRFASLQLLETVEDPDTFLFTEYLQYECRQWYKKFVYDAALGTTTQMIVDLDNDCDFEKNGGVVEQIESEIERDTKKYFHKEIEQCDIPQNATIDLVNEWFSYRQEIVGCYK